MGLRGMARRAGAARGAYMAEMENYHRQRQGLYDDMALQRFGMDQQRFDMDRRKFKEDLIDRETQRKQKAEEHQWAGELHKDNLTTNIYRRDALRAQERQHNAQTQAVENRTKREDENYKNYTIPYNGLMLEWAKGRVDAQDQTIEANNLALDAAKKNAQTGTMGGPMGQMGRMGTRTPTRQVPGNPLLQSGGTSVKPASDTRIKASAEAVTPGQMKLAFNRKFYDTDANIQKRTGMSRNELMEAIAGKYRSHINSAGVNAMDEDDFIRQELGRYGFWDIDDLGRLMNSINNARSNKPTLHGFWESRNDEEEYARRNPAFYKKQKQIIDDVMGAKIIVTHPRTGKMIDIDPATKNKALRDPNFVRLYRKGIDKHKLSPEKAFQYATDEIFRGAR